MRAAWIAMLVAIMGSYSLAEEIPLHLRDPFQMPEIVKPKRKPKTGLELYDLDQLDVVGILTGAESLRAMIAAPDGKTFFVTERAKIGGQGGVITKIEPNAVYVMEEVVNQLGRVENRERELPLKPDIKKGLDSSKEETKTEAMMAPEMEE